jgi:lauroyl/myristoyl acyltransferase
MTALLLFPLTLFIKILRKFIASLSPSAGLRVCLGIMAIFSFIQRRRCLNNLRKVFGPLGKDEAAIEHLRKDHVRYLASFLYELILLPHTSPEELQQRIIIEGENHLRESQRTGGLLIGSHLGNFLLMRAGLTANGFYLANVSNKIPLPGLEELFCDVRKRHAITTAYVGTGARALAMETLARHGFFSISFDIATPKRASESRELPFGGATIDIDLGPEQLALALNVPVFWIGVRTAPDGKHLIFIEPLQINRGDRSENNALALALHWTEKLYREVLERPEEWWHWNNLVLGENPDK